MKERLYFLDVLRVAATCAVVMIHMVTGVMDATDMSLYPVEKKVFLMIMDLVCWSVPVFILISGYLFLNPEKEISFGKMVTRYCRRILLALLLFGVPYACLELAMTEKTFRLGMLWEGFLMVLRGKSWSHMWYLYLILFLYLLTPALKRVLDRLPKQVLYVILSVIFIGSSVLPFVKKIRNLPEAFFALPDDCIYLFYYICGYLFAVKKQTEKRMTPFFGFLTAALAFGMAGSRISGSYTLQMAYNYPFTVLLSLSLFGTCLGEQRRAAIKSTGFWGAASALSFGVYLIHPVFLNTAYKFLGITPLSFSIWLSLPVFFLGTLLLAAAGAWALRKLPPLRKYVL